MSVLILECSLRQAMTHVTVSEKLEPPYCAAHLLDDIIDNLATVSGDYYQKRTMTYHLVRYALRCFWA